MPTWTFHSLILTPLILWPLPFVLTYRQIPGRLALILALLSLTPCLQLSPGPGLLAACLSGAFLLAAHTSPGHDRTFSTLALLWLLPLLSAQPSQTMEFLPLLLKFLLALTVVLSLATVLHAPMRWPLALILAVLPYAARDQPLWHATDLQTDLPWPTLAVRWQFHGPGVFDLAQLPPPWPHMPMLVRMLALVSVLAAIVLRARNQRRWLLSVALLPLVGVLLLLIMTLLTRDLPAHAQGYPLASGPFATLDASLLLLATARAATLAWLLLADLPAAAISAVPAASAAGFLLLALAFCAPAVAGPTWLADPAALAAVAVLATAFVRARADSPVLAQAAGALLTLAALTLAGANAAAWAGSSLIFP